MTNQEKMCIDCGENPAKANFSYCTKCHTARTYASRRRQEKRRIALEVANERLRIFEKELEEKDAFKDTDVYNLFLFAQMMVKHWNPPGYGARE